MIAKVNLYSNKKGEVNKFLSSFYNANLELEDNLKWEKEYANPIEIAEIIGTFIDNSDKFQLNMWICIDKNVYINITPDNVNSVIKYLYERFPY